MKKWGHLSGFHILFLIYGPEIVQNVYFCNFLQTSERNAGLLKQFTCEHIKVPITLF